MSKLELILLGRFECLLSTGTRVSLSMRKAEVLLAFLALAPGLRHPRERLINLLWSDRGDEQARNSLRQCLSAIRKSLGEAADMVLQIDRTTVCLNAELIDIDVHEFERLADSGDYESLMTAADLYQGEFLEGISIRDAASQEWLDSERARFKRQFVEILHRLAETQFLSHDYAHATVSAERLVEQDPLDEAGWRLLMQSHAAAGNRNHALQAFKRCQQILQQELGIEAEGATVELRERIAAGDSGQTGTAPAPRVSPDRDQQASQAVEHSIVVLPFDNLSGDPEQEYFSDGITDSIIMNLALFPDLLVKSRNSSFAFKQQIKSLGEISRELGVDYLVEGSVRRSSGRIRVNVTLIEAASGNQVWGKRYDSGLEDLFELEEDLCRSVAATVTGKIESELQRIALAKGAADQQAYDLLLAGIYHLQRANRKDNAIAIEKLNACLERDPDNARAHAWLYDCHHFSVMDRWSDDLDQSRQLAVKHIQRAIKLAPEQKSVLLSYIDYLTFQHRYDEAEVQVQRALAINPNEAGAYAARAVNLSSMGQWPEAVEAAEIALRLDPYNYWGMWILAEALFFCDRYAECLETIARTDNAPGFVLVYSVAANIELGRRDAAQKSLDQFIQFCGENMLTPPTSNDEWRQYFLDNAPFADAAVNERILNLLLEAGLEKKMAGKSSAPQKSDQGSSTIAVLPFDNLSGDPEQEYFSDGITESVILNLALFTGLRVKSRNSSFAFKQQLKGLAEISRELDVDYIVEGSVRKIRDRIRITAQLIDAASGNQVWGNRYEAGLDELFDLEQELSRAIAATVTGKIESELRRIAIAKGAADQQAYDLLLAGMYHAYRFNINDNSIAIDMFERCLAQDPGNVRAHIGLYICHAMASSGRWVENCAAAFHKAQEYIRRALELDPDDLAVQTFYAEMLTFDGKADKALPILDKVLARNPGDTEALAVLAYAQSATLDPAAALQTAERALTLDPYHLWAEWELAVAKYLCGHYEDALETIAISRAPPGFITIFAVAALVKLGRAGQAREMLQEFLDECETEMYSPPSTLDEWLQYTRSNYIFEDPQLNRDLLDCLVEAGLEEMLPANWSRQDIDSLPSILVLPFSNQSGDPQQEYFSDGVTASVILSLGLFDGIAVKSQKTSFAFKNSELSSVEIAEKVGADYLVEGSIRKSAQSIRLSVQLIDAASGSQLWGQQFDEELKDILDLEQELSRALAATISGRLGHRIQQRAARKPAKDLKSYDHLLRGLYHFGKFTAEDLKIARDEIDKCIARDPGNVQAHANLAEAYVVELLENWAEDRELAERKAFEHFETALELDPDNALAHAYFADFLTILGDYNKAEFHAERAVELNPNSSEGHAVKTDLLTGDRRHEEAIREADISLQLDPYSVGSGWMAGYAYRNAGRYAEAIRILRRIPHPPPTINAYIAGCFVGMGLEEEARTEMRRFLKLAAQQMSPLPDSIDAWREHWRNGTTYRHDEDFELFFNQLVDAGLCDPQV